MQSVRMAYSYVKHKELTVAFRPENLYRPGVPYPVKVLCYQAIADLFEYLPRSKADPSDVQARQALQVAAWMALWPIEPEKFS